MKSFLEEYGLAIFAIICIVMLILIATPVGQAISTAITSIVTSFTTTTTGYMNTIELPSFK